MDDILISITLALGACTLLYFLVSPYLSGELKSEKRLQSQLLSVDEKRLNLAKNAQANRKTKIDEVIKELDKSENIKNPPLATRLEQAGLKWDKKKFYIFSAACAGIAFVVMLLLGRTFLFALASTVFWGFGFPRMFLNFKKRKRIKAFTEELPSAIDVIVRAVKAGLPINDAMRIVATEAKEPVKGEFVYLIELQQMGMSLAEAVTKFPQRMPTPEANFFSIAIIIQQKAGGSISEILNNLSVVLRERKKLINKVKSLSQEAKSSAAIIGSIPFLLSGFLVMFSPQHMVPLFKTSAGNLMLMACAAIMCLGIFIMHKMINIEV